MTNEQNLILQALRTEYIINATEDGESVPEATADAEYNIKFFEDPDTTAKVFCEECPLTGSNQQVPLTQGFTFSDPPASSGFALCIAHAAQQLIPN